MARAKEKIEVVLTSVQVEKQTNQKYNENDFLDAYISNEIKDIEIIDEIIIVDSYAFELDRSVPKLGEYIGKKEELVFPDLEVSKPIVAEDSKTASFNVTAREKENGINRIEVWLNGVKIEKQTKNYDDIKTEINEVFTVNQNGVYTVKVYGSLMISKIVEVIGIVPSIEFVPNGNTQWKKQHTTKIVVKETGERIASLKYKWTEDKANEPAPEEFTQKCPKDNLIIDGENTMTGTYFLWILLITESGKTNIYASEGFNFDNKGVEALTATLNEKTGDIYTLNIECIKGLSDIDKIEIINNGEKKETMKQSNTKWSVEIINSLNYIRETIFEVTYSSGDIFRYSMESIEDFIEMWDIRIDRTYGWNWGNTTKISTYGGQANTATVFSKIEFNEKTGRLRAVSNSLTTWGSLKQGDIFDTVNAGTTYSPKLFVSSSIATSGEYKNMMRLTYKVPEIKVIKEEKLKGENLLGVQFCANQDKLMPQGINSYMNNEYYCIRNGI